MATRDPTTQPVQPTLDLDDGRMVFKKEPIAATEAASVSPVQTHRDTSITKVNARYSPRGKYAKYLATESKFPYVYGRRTTRKLSPLNALMKRRGTPLWA
jgi:hypothetical protein